MFSMFAMKSVCRGVFMDTEWLKFVQKPSPDLFGTSDMLQFLRTILCGASLKCWDNCSTSLQVKKHLQSFLGHDLCHVSFKLCITNAHQAKTAGEPSIRWLQERLLYMRKLGKNKAKVGVLALAMHCAFLSLLSILTVAIFLYLETEKNNKNLAVLHVCSESPPYWIVWVWQLELALR